MKAIWNGTILADSEQTIEVDGYTYFPPGSVKKEHLKATATTSICPWKGSAKYFSVTINGNENPDAAWTYENPKPAASKIKGYVGFWRGIDIKK